MAYWAESQGQSPVYAKYCTLPGPNCTHMYHDRHKATYLPSPLCDQREPSCWTVPGSRTGGVMHDYTNWTNPDLATPAASHFPFGLDNPNKDHPEAQEMRGRERQGGGFRVGPEREYELGTLNEGWQRRWEPSCSSSSSLSDNSYRELQAWAARYSHSLPRRRRMGAEMKGAFQEAPEGSRTLGRVNRNAPDSNMAALQRTGSSSSARGPWDVGGQQKTMTYNPLPVCPPETTMERNYQRMRFSQPPGYICPPAYDGQHNSSPVMQIHNTFSTDQQGNRNTYHLKSLPNQNISIDLQDKISGNKEIDTKEAQKQRSALDPNVYEYQMQATDALWKNQPIHSQPSQIQPDSHSSQREVQESKSTEGIHSNVIEGRKFKLNKKTGGATIFCLVSRIGGTPSETSRENVETALSHCTPKTNSETSELGGIAKGVRDDNDIINRITKFADEVDFTEEKQSGIPVEHHIPTRDGEFKATCKDTIGLVESQQAAGHSIESQTGYSLANQSHFQSTTEKDGGGDVKPVVGPQAGQTLPVRFPLWREPGYTARMDVNSSLPCRGLVNKCPTVKSPEMCGHPIDIEVRRFEIKEDQEPESCGGQLVIDTTSVLVRMELIPSPKKEHVNYLFHPPYNPPHVDAGDIVESIQTQVNPVPADDEPQPQPQPELEKGKPIDPTNEDTMKAEELQSDKASEALPCLPQITFPEKETLKARAERILGIPLFDSDNEQVCEETLTVHDPCSQNQNDECETSPPGNNITDVLCLTGGTQKEMVPQQLPDDHANDSVCVQDRNITQDVLDTELNEEPEILWEGKPHSPDLSEDVIEDCESQDVKSVLHEQVFKSDSQEDSTENDLPNENNASPPSDPSNLQPESPSDSPCPTRHSSLSCESTTETVPPSVFREDSSESPETSTHTDQEPCSLAFPLPSSSSPENPSLNLHCLDLSVHEEDSTLVLEVCEEEKNELDDSLQLTNDDITDITDDINECLLEDDTQEPDPRLPLKCDENADCQKDNIVTLVQPAKELNEDLTELEEQIARSEDNTIDFEPVKEVNGLQELKITTEPLLESCSQEQSHEETDGNEDDVCPQTVIQCLNLSIDLKHTVDSQWSPSVSDIMPSLDKSTSLSDVSDCNSEPILQTDLASLSVSENIGLHPEPFLSGISETSPSDFLESHTPPLILPSSPPSDSPRGSSPPQEEEEEEDTVPPELPSSIKDTEQSQYPRSLWDAVNRIRKHTAPDSENEDEEVSELWDPQNAGDMVSIDVESEVDMKPEDIVFANSEGTEKATVSSTDHDSSNTEEEIVLDETTLPEDLKEEEQLEDATVGLMQRDEYHEVGLQDEDSLSCSSITSHGSEETAVNSVEEVEKEDINNNPDLVMKLPKFSHVTPPLFRDLRWLPVAARIRFKTMVLTYKAVNGTAPTYLQALVRSHGPARALRATTSARQLVPPSLRASKGCTAKSQLFSVLAPLWWNKLPADVKTAESITCFRKRLKTHLFRVHLDPA
ncbi:hypothetical protein N1851_015555 [Merluccius polli]|uniref:Uncharacterized protein n=1 Tax=Merluccius polli TaxID=89951 RepID=A0AA47MSU7_MERPO|nr:hypothetical protein N1851_015555 [Merluccius polli]